MSYYAKEFCKITGLKPDTLRYYVDQGLVSPQINPGNHYKEYSELDVLDMYYIRSRRAMNVPIVKINQVITHLPVEEQLSWLKEHEQNLLEQQRMIDIQLRRCRKMQKDIRNLAHLLGHIIDQSGQEGPDLLQINLIGAHAEDPRRFKLAESWREVYPNLLNIIHVPLSELLDDSCERYSVSFGVAIPEQILEHAPHLCEAPAYRYPSQDCIGTMIQIHQPFELTRKDLRPLFDYAREKHYTFVDDLTSWMITKTQENGTDWYYFATRVSVRHEET